MTTTIQQLNERIEASGVSRGAGTFTARVNGNDVAMSLDVAGKVWIDA